jgi:hypothetical protein
MSKISIVIYVSLDVTGCCLNFPYYHTSPAQGTRCLCQSTLVCLLISYSRDIIPSRGKKMCLSKGSIESGVHVVSSFVVTGCLHTGIKQTSSEADTYSHSCAEVKKKVELYLHSFLHLNVVGFNLEQGQYICLFLSSSFVLSYKTENFFIIWATATSRRRMGGETKKR